MQDFSLILTVALSGMVGAALAAVLACVPGLHVYNLLGVTVLLVQALAGQGVSVPADVLIPLAVGMVTAYSVVNTVPSVLLAAPDESAFFTVLPGQKYLLSGRGYEGVWVTAVGGIGGVLLLLAAAPVLPRVVPVMRDVLSPHFHWIVWCVISFMLLSEWPKGGTRGQGGWRKLASAWQSLGAGLLTFFLSAALGFVLFFRSPIGAGSAFQSLMPAFVGLFTLPWLILNIATSVEPPAQSASRQMDLDAEAAVKGIGAGVLGGSFAGFVPAVTGGVGGFLAGHATALSDDRAFLISQGTSKLIYYVGGLLLFFVPGSPMTRGGAAWMLKGLVWPRGLRDYYMVLGVIALAGSVSVVLLGPLTRGVLCGACRWGYRRISAAALVFIVVMVIGVTGLPGLLVMVVGGAIGIIPVLWGSRRMNCLGIILVPVACNMSGIGAPVARFLGLL